MKKQVEAIVLAGGKGTRLAPLTEDTPKPLLKVMGKAVLENVIDRILLAGIPKAFVTTMYLPWQIEGTDIRRAGLKISYIREKEPLGTAGCTANAFSGNADAAIVLSGDGMYDFELDKIIDFHFEKGADVTIVTYQSENPLDYGVVLYDDEGRITRFEEKPPWAKVVSGKVNTGIYVINRDILEMIPKKGEYDFAKQLFPLLLAKNKLLFAYEAKGTWHDIGDLDGYFEANKSALDGKINGMENRGFNAKELAESGIEAESPFYVSKSAVLGTNIKIGAYTVIGDGAVISDGCDISGSIISDGVSLGAGCGVYDSIIGRNTRLGENCMISEGCAIGANATSADSIILPKYSVIHSASHINQNEYRGRPCGKREKNLFTDSGIVCDLSEKSPEYVMRIGCAAVKAVSESKGDGSVRIGVMTDTNGISLRAGRLMLEGIRSEGVRSIDFGLGYEALGIFAARELITDCLIYISRNAKGIITAKMYDSAGKEFSDSFERSLTGAFFSIREYCCPERVYEPDRMRDMGMLYYSHIIKEARKRLEGGKLEGFVCAFGNMGNVQANSPVHTALCAISELGGSITKNPQDARVCFEIDADGLCSSCISHQKVLDCYHMNAILLSKEKPAVKGELFDFPDAVPQIYKSIAEKSGFSIKNDASFAGTQENRPIYPEYMQDGVLRTILFAVLLHKENTDTESLSKQFPSFEVYSESFEGTSCRATAMHRLSRLANFSCGADGKGVKILLPTGTVTVIPGKVSGFKLYSEAASMEAAKELCITAEQYLK